MAACGDLLVPVRERHHDVERGEREHEVEEAVAVCDTFLLVVPHLLSLLLLVVIGACTPSNTHQTTRDRRSLLVTVLIKIKMLTSYACITRHNVSLIHDAIARHGTLPVRLYVHA